MPRLPLKPTRLAALLLAALPAAAQDLAPISFASIVDEPRDGLGDGFNQTPFVGVISESAAREERTAQEFAVQSLSGTTIASATISGRILPLDMSAVGPRAFDFLLYAGNGSADLSDFEIPATLVGSASFAPPAQDRLDFAFECTAEVQALLSGGASFIGLKIVSASEPNPRSFSTAQTVLSISDGGELGTPFCSGDGSGAPCPCGNPGQPGRGCANGVEPAGARLLALGSRSLVAADLVLAGEGLQPGQHGVYFQGDDAAGGGVGVPFGDGLRCTGLNAVRLQTVVADGAGRSTTNVDIGLAGGIVPGQTRAYQLWYRNPAASPCGGGFNLSNGLLVTWFP